MESDFGSFYASVAPSVERLAVALTGDRHEASHLTQAVFERQLRKWSRLAVESPHSYARSAQLREIASSRRVGFRKQEMPTDEPPAVAPEPDFSGASDEADRLVTALRTLPARQRQAVVLRYLEDLSTAQTADLMGCTQGTVKRAAYDGLNALRSRLTEHSER